MDELTPLQKERYERHLMLPEIGEQGQALLLSRRVLVVGVGGLGSPILYYLVAGGVGHITIVDFDRIGLSNLQRQILYRDEDLGKPKATTAADRLRALNRDVTITAIDDHYTHSNALDIARGHDLIIDGTDNLATRYLLDDTARELGIPYLYGAVSAFVGQCSLFHYQGAGGYRDLFPDYDTTYDATPVGLVSAIPGVVGTLMATEALKILLGLPSSLAGHIYRIDATTFSSHLISIT